VILLETARRQIASATILGYAAAELVRMDEQVLSDSYYLSPGQCRILKDLAR
jgi:hypothetical protein